MKIFRTILFIVLLFQLPINLSFGQHEGDEFFIIPPEYSNTQGTAGFLGPLSNGNRSYQLLIHQDLLVDLVGKELKGLSWRIPASAAASWPASDITYENYDIYLSESVPPANRSFDFANNVVGVQTLVRSDSLTITANSYPSGSTPNDWGTEILFDTSWLYSGSHLLIEIRHSTNPGSNQSTDAIGTSTSGYGTLFSALWQSSFTPTTGLQGNFSIVRLTADEPVPVELTSFNALVSANSVRLEWTTATEINNYGFEVERKSEDSNFETIGFITGAGSTTEARNYSFADHGLTNGSYTYRLRQLDFDGTFEYSYEINAEVLIPSEYTLEQNYPNPFNPSTNITFNILEGSNVKLTVFNTLGEKVKLIVDEYKEAGTYSVSFDASSLTSGVYFYQLETPQFIQSKKMILSR